MPFRERQRKSIAAAHNSRMAGQPAPTIERSRATVPDQPALRIDASGMIAAKRWRTEAGMPVTSSPDSYSSSSRLACSR
jgi:hypothetical protein